MKRSAREALEWVKQNIIKTILVSIALFSFGVSFNFVDITLFQSLFTNGDNLDVIHSPCSINTQSQSGGTNTVNCDKAEVPEVIKVEEMGVNNQQDGYFEHTFKVYVSGVPSSGMLDFETEGIESLYTEKPPRRIQLGPISMPNRQEVQGYLLTLYTEEEINPEEVKINVHTE